MTDLVEIIIQITTTNTTIVSPTHPIMNKTNLIHTIKSLDTPQAQIWYDHITVYVQAHKHYPRLRYLQNKIAWFEKIDADLSKTISTMMNLGYVKLADWRMIARMLIQYHTLVIADVMRIPAWSTIAQSDGIVLHNIQTGVDLIQWDNRYSRNLDTDLQKLLN